MVLETLDLYTLNCFIVDEEKHKLNAAGVTSSFIPADKVICDEIMNPPVGHTTLLKVAVILTSC